MADRGGPGIGSGEPRLAGILERNIEALLERQRAEERGRTRQERIADRFTTVTGSLPFVYVHLILFGGWILWNLPFSPLPRFDPSLAALAGVASMEAIFLSAFILITQNRMTAAADKRANLELQISLLAEHEVTRLIRLTSAIGERLGVQESRTADLHELKRDVQPEAVLDRMERAAERYAREEGPEPDR